MPPWLSVVTAGKKQDNFRSSLANLDPIAQRLNPDFEREFITEFLTEKQRGKFAVARQYSQELKNRMMNYWTADEFNQEPKDVKPKNMKKQFKLPFTGKDRE